MADEKRAEELLGLWKDCLDEMAGTEYDCSFDCGSHQGEDVSCYHKGIFEKEEEKATEILGELLSLSPERDEALRKAEDECRRAERKGWAMRRGLRIIEKFRR